MSFFQSVILYILGFYYQVFSRVNYNDGREVSATNDKAGLPQEESSENVDGAVEGDSIDDDTFMDEFSKTALDQFQITTVLKNERYFRDCRQWQKLRNCYHPEAAKTRIQVGAYGVCLQHPIRQ